MLFGPAEYAARSLVPSPPARITTGGSFSASPAFFVTLRVTPAKDFSTPLQMFVAFSRFRPIPQYSPSRSPSSGTLSPSRNSLPRIAARAPPFFFSAPRPSVISLLAPRTPSRPARPTVPLRFSPTSPRRPMVSPPRVFPRRILHPTCCSLLTPRSAAPPPPTLAPHMASDPAQSPLLQIPLSPYTAPGLSLLRSLPPQTWLPALLCVSLERSRPENTSSHGNSAGTENSP